jgi:hypothetical protein
MNLGGFLFVVGTILLSQDSQDRMIAAATCMISIGYFVMGIILAFKRKRPKPGFALVRVLQGFGMIVYCIGSGLKFSNIESSRYTYSKDLRSGGVAIGLLASIFPFIWTLSYASNEIFSPGNFEILADIFSFAGFFTLFLKAIAASSGQNDSCKVACPGAQQLGSIFFSGASCLYLIYHILSLDLATVEDPLPYDIFSPSSPAALKAPASDEHQPSVKFEKIEIPENAVVWETSVFVIGCGPTGLTLANELGQRGVDMIIIDMRTKVLPDSRFFNLLYTTCEGLKRLGVLDKVLNLDLHSRSPIY